MKDKKVSVIVPCYYSTNTLTPIVNQIIDVLTQEYYEYEVILVDDGSKDNTYEKMQKLSKENHNIKCIKFSQNYGQHAALIAGYGCVTGDIIVGLNDDGEHDPKDIPVLIKKLQEGYDYVCAKHHLKKHTLIQKIGSRFNNFCCINLLEQPDDFYFSSYYAMNKFLIREIIKNKNPFVNVNGLILSITKKVADVEIPAHERKAGNSGYSFRKSVLLWANSFTAFTIKPLRISFYIGIILAIVSVIYMAFLMILLLGKNINFDFSMLLNIFILVICSMLFFVLGIIGEYIGRIYLVLSGKPQYIIEETINMNQNCEVK
jgi:glycosyltransferase involved in cell wall biosynthesis